MYKAERSGTHLPERYSSADRCSVVPGRCGRDCNRPAGGLRGVDCEGVPVVAVGTDGEAVGSLRRGRGTGCGCLAFPAVSGCVHVVPGLPGLPCCRRTGRLGGLVVWNVDDGLRMCRPDGQRARGGT